MAAPAALNVGMAATALVECSASGNDIRSGDQPRSRQALGDSPVHSQAIICNSEDIGPHLAQEKSDHTASIGGNIMHETHRKAAEQHELAAHAHRTADEHHEKGDDEGGNWHAQRALAYSDHAYRLAQEAHTKSGQMAAL
jgi:hypothetical protein